MLGYLVLISISGPDLSLFGWPKRALRLALVVTALLVVVVRAHPLPLDRARHGRGPARQRGALLRGCGTCPVRPAAVGLPARQEPGRPRLHRGRRAAARARDRPQAPDRGHRGDQRPGLGHRVANLPGRAGLRPGLVRPAPTAERRGTPAARGRVRGGPAVRAGEVRTGRRVRRPGGHRLVPREDRRGVLGQARTRPRGTVRGSARPGSTSRTAPPTSSTTPTGRCSSRAAGSTCWPRSCSPSGSASARCARALRPRSRRSGEAANIVVLICALRLGEVFGATAASIALAAGLIGYLQAESLRTSDRGVIQ